jgi:hypothetical protein
MSRTVFTPAQMTATGVRASSVRSAEMSKLCSPPRWTPPMPAHHLGQLHLGIVMNCTFLVLLRLLQEILPPDLYTTSAQLTNACQLPESASSGWTNVQLRLYSDMFRVPESFLLLLLLQTSQIFIGTLCYTGYREPEGGFVANSRESPDT